MTNFQVTVWGLCAGLQGTLYQYRPKVGGLQSNLPPFVQHQHVVSKLPSLLIRAQCMQVLMKLIFRGYLPSYLQYDIIIFEHPFANHPILSLHSHYVQVQQITMYTFYFLLMLLILLNYFLRVLITVFLSLHLLYCIILLLILCIKVIQGK